MSRSTLTKGVEGDVSANNSPEQATGDTPLIDLQKLRVAAARRLLESDHRGVQEISEAVGYQDAAFFRTIFERHTGASPSAYRSRFGLVA